MSKIATTTGLAVLLLSAASLQAAVPAAAVLHGGVAGAQLAPKAAFFNTYLDPNKNEGQIYVVTDQNDFCDQVGNQTWTANSNTLVLLLLHGSDTSFPDTGDYQVSAQIGAPLTAQASWVSLGAGCAKTQTGSVKGEVTTSYVTADTGLGAFTLRMGPHNDLVSGSFHAVHCAALDASVVAGTWGKTCR